MFLNCHIDRERGIAEINWISASRINAAKQNNIPISELIISKEEIDIEMKYWEPYTAICCTDTDMITESFSNTLCTLSRIKLGNDKSLHATGFDLN